MSPTPAILARLRRPRPEPKPPAPEIPIEQWTPRPEATFSELDAYREGVILDHLAHATTIYDDPREAAMRMFGGQR